MRRLLFAVLFAAFCSFPVPAGAADSAAGDCTRAGDPGRVIAGCRGEAARATRRHEAQMVADNGPSSAPSDAFQLFQRGYGLLQKGESGHALADFEAAIRADPGSAWGYFGRGLHFLQKAANDRAIADFDEAIRRDPKLAVAYAARGLALVQKSEYQRALPDFDHALRLDPRIPLAHVGRGTAYLDQGAHDRALDEFDAALRLDANFAPAYSGRGLVHGQQGRFDRAIADFDEAIRRDPSDKIALNNRGVMHGRRGDLDRALADYEAALRLDPNLALAIGNRGLVFARKGDLDRAFRDLEAAIRLDPKDAKLIGARGLVYSQQGDLDRAISDYGQAIRLNGKYVEAYVARAIAWSRKGRYDAAIADYDAALRLAPPVFPTAPVRGYAHCGNAPSERAVADWDEAIAFNLRLAALTGRGCAYLKTADPARALADLNEAVRLNPQFAEAFATRGAVHAAKGDAGQAEHDYAAALRLDPTLKRARESLDALRRTAPPPQSPQHLGGQRVALVIGVDAYRNVPPLQAAVNDARAVAKAIGELGFEVLTGENLDYPAMSRKLIELEQRIEPGHSIFFFFAGHGFAIEGRNYLLPADIPLIGKGQEGLFENAAFAADRLLERFRQRGARTAILILDACRNNPFEGTGAKRSLMPGTRGLVRMEPPEGAFVLFSAATGQTALDRLGPDDRNPNSVFTRVFLEELKRDRASVLDIAKATQVRVRDLARKAGKEQRPAYYDEIVGQFALRP